VWHIVISCFADMWKSWCHNSFVCSKVSEDVLYNRLEQRQPDGRCKTGPYSLSAWQCAGVHHCAEEFMQCSCAVVAAVAPSQHSFICL